MVKCLECKKEFKAIVEFHLKYHKMTFKKYRAKYPNAKIIDDYNCERCDELVVNSKSKRAKYCRDCAKIIKNYQITMNSREYQRKNRLMNEKWYGDANKEYGIQVNENSPMADRVRVDSTHSQWDVDASGKKTLGTFNERSLDVNKKTGRIKQFEWFEKQKRKIKESKKRR